VEEGEVRARANDDVVANKVARGRSSIAEDGGEIVQMSRLAELEVEGGERAGRGLRRGGVDALSCELRRFRRQDQGSPIRPYYMQKSRTFITIMGQPIDMAGVRTQKRGDAGR
jgi:hypothetical protein